MYLPLLQGFQFALPVHFSFHEEEQIVLIVIMLYTILSNSHTIQLPQIDYKCFHPNFKTYVIDNRVVISYFIGPLLLHAFANLHGKCIGHFTNYVRREIIDKLTHIKI